MVSQTRRWSDIFLAVLVLAIASMLLVPLPTPLLSFLLVLNISFALLVLLVGLYTPNVLALLSFPSLLLLTTLFRLSLNVATSRLILTNGDAGAVIQAFGTFLIKGQVVVGIIIFTIITIVNFIVIARGSSRVSEVAARFALDALPGKQLSIDADLRAGMITPGEAQFRRDELRRESQLYGSMDGAMKFVQGDAIAGFFIILTNIFGGLYLGISRGDTASEAVQRYTILTVGDGLVTQIPALLISICAGIMVTRVSSAERTTLGADVGAQLFARPPLVMFCGFCLLLFSVLPGLPWIPFASVGIVLLTSGYLLGRRPLEAASLSPAFEVLNRNHATLSGRGSSPALLPPPVEGQGAPLVIRLDSSVLYKFYMASKERYTEWWRLFGESFYDETGVRLPAFAVAADEFSSGNNYDVHLEGASIDTGRIPLDSIFVEVDPTSASALGLEVVQEAEHPLTGGRAFWARENSMLSRAVESGDFRGYDFFQYICLRIGIFLQRNPEDILTLTVVHEMLKELDKRHPGLVSEAFQNKFISMSRLTDVLQELVREGISIREFRPIVESIARYCASHGLTLTEEDAFDLQDVVSFIRVGRKRQLLSRYLTDRRTLKVVTLSPEVDEVFDALPEIDSSSALPIPPETFENIREGLRSLLDPASTRGLLPVTVLCRAELRYKVSRFVRSCNKMAGVITFDELDPLVSIEPVGTWVM